MKQLSVLFTILLSLLPYSATFAQTPTLGCLSLRNSTWLGTANLQKFYNSAKQTLPLELRITSVATGIRGVYRIEGTLNGMPLDAATCAESDVTAHTVWGIALYTKQKNRLSATANSANNNHPSTLTIFTGAWELPDGGYAIQSGNLIRE